MLRRADTAPAGPLLARLHHVKNADEADTIALIKQIVEDSPCAMEVIACSDDFDWIVRNLVLSAAAR
jgi:hypothetical protein